MFDIQSTRSISQQLQLLSLPEFDKLYIMKRDHYSDNGGHHRTQISDKAERELESNMDFEKVTK